MGRSHGVTDHWVLIFVIFDNSGFGKRCSVDQFKSNYTAALGHKRNPT